MNPQALIVIGVIGGALLVLVLDQVRRDRLYVGYAVAIIVAVVAVLAIASIPVILRAITQVIGPVLPEAALSLLSITFILFVLVYVLTQVTLVANRVAAVVQEMAIRSAGHDAAPPEDAALGDDGQETTPEGEPFEGGEP